MRILTHNFMQCPRSKSYPLRLVPTELETVEAEYSGEFIEHILKRLNWDVLRSTASELELGELPETMPESEESNPEAFKLLHKILMEVRSSPESRSCRLSKLASFFFFLNPLRKPSILHTLDARQVRDPRERRWVDYLPD
mmetsp:Transcript_35907/g.143530  ORF Transcript_35907/g.143530 Transcript_35907/m.143530 type:complete len:140 (-) Transcript_35907:2275-2694(-)